MRAWRHRSLAWCRSLGYLWCCWWPAGVMVTHLPARQLGLTAATMLLQRIRGFARPAREVILPMVIDEDRGLSLIEGFAES